MGCGWMCAVTGLMWISCYAAIAICCCVKIRIPRTKHEIEADYERRKLEKAYGKELQKQGKEMVPLQAKTAAAGMYKCIFISEFVLYKIIHVCTNAANLINIISTTCLC